MNSFFSLKSIFCLVLVLAQGSAMAQKEKLSSGAFSKYDKLFRGNLDDINLPDFTDGPYFFRIDENLMKVRYIDHNQEENSISIREKKIKLKTDSLQFKGLKKDKNNYWLYKGAYPIQKEEFSHIDRIMAIGDVHGEYDHLVELLQKHGVINQDLNWSWGNSHLVFIGDIFDRGNKVTECLYLIKKLQRQAKLQGGRLHYLLGNHEIMVLMNDSRYVAPKYKNMCKRLMVNYPRFFKEDTELGKWLRSQNSVVKIDDLIFVHGGISPDLVDQKQSLHQINENVRMSLKSDNGKTHEQIMKDIYFPANPLWYRGYLMRTRSYSIIEDAELDRVLNYYQASKILFGHTEVDGIRYLQGKRLIALNVPMGYKEITPQILLIDRGKFYRCFIDGSKELMN